MPERMNGERLCYLASMARWTEVKEMALDLLDARRERDEAHETIAWITGTDDVESVIAGAMAALAAKGGGDGESRLERIRRLIEEQYIECPTGCGASFEELLCYELHDGGLTFRALAQKWNIGLPTLGSLIADHCERL
jgi:hypothetical protein